MRDSAGEIGMDLSAGLDDSEVADVGSESVRDLWWEMIVVGFFEKSCDLR